MKNHHEVGHFKNRLMIVLLSLFTLVVTAGQSFAATTCSTCHGMPPLDSSDGSRQPATGAFKGSHQTHLSPAGAAAECVKCHNSANHTNSHAATDGYNISIASNIFSSPSTAKYSKGTLFAQTATPTLGTCRNVTCHFETLTPTWGKAPAASVATNCNTCHATPRGASGSHAKHEAFYGGLNSCSQCHPSYGFGSYSTAASESKFSHATSAGKHKVVVSSFLPYSGGTTTSWLPSQVKVFGSCRATLCHDTGRDGARTIAWNTSKAACTACHALSPATFSHPKHMTGLNPAQFASTVNCASCHKGYVQGTTASADHLDGDVDVYYTTAGDLGYPLNKVKGSAVSSCTTSYCHSNGKSLFASATWGGTSTGCNFCHPNLSAGHAIHVGTLQTEISLYAYTSTKSAGTGFKFGCANCHPLTVANHMNGTVDVDMAASASGGHLKALNGAWTYTASQCNNIYCHSNGYKPGASYTFALTPTWLGTFTGDRCAACHGNSPNSVPATQPGSPAHTAHAVGIHYDDIFNGVSKKLPQGGGSTVNAAHGRNNRSTTINCNICHSITVTTFANDQNSLCSSCHKVGGNPAPLVGNLAVADASKHVNGLVDVNFINQKIATKAQVAPSAFSGYTATTAGGWSRNKNIYKTYTSGYDVTKAVLSASPAYSAAGCAVACHNNITVKWTDSVTCTNCHTRLK